MAHQRGLGSAPGNFSPSAPLKRRARAPQDSAHAPASPLACFFSRQAVKQLLELPLNLTIVSPAHTPNWDLVSDVVNSCSRIYRSPKQCRSRYENVIIPREEGKVAERCCSFASRLGLLVSKPLPPLSPPLVLSVGV